MTIEREPQRWLDDVASDPALRELLEAGRGDGPSQAALKAAPAAVAALLSTQLLTSSAAALGAGKAAGGMASVGLSTASTTLLAVKWVVLGAVVGTSVSMATVVLRERSATPHTAPGRAGRALKPEAGPRTLPSKLTGSAGPQQREAFATQRDVPDRAPAALSSTGARAAASGPPVAEGTERLAASNKADLSLEVGVLDAARSALARADAERALSLLEQMEYLPARALAPEAAVLRVRALLQLGQRNEATRVASQFIERHPNAPQARVLRALLAGTPL